MSKANGEITLRARAHAPGLRGTFLQVIGPGWKLFGKTYEEWNAMEPGWHDIVDGPADEDYCPPELAIPE